MTTRSSLAASFIILLLAAGAMVALDRYGTASRVSGRIGDLQDRNIIRELVDAPRDAYRFWKKSGYRGRTVVFVDDRWESFDPGDLIQSQMFRAYPLQLYNTARLLEDEHVNGVTFLYVAMMNKILRRIVAVVPEAEVDRMRQMIPKVKDSRASARGVFLSRQGFPRWYSTGANFTATREPVLLYVGASYFKNAEPEELMCQLTTVGLKTDCIILCREVGKGSVGTPELARLDRFARLLGISPTVTGSGSRMDSGASMHPGGAPASREAK